MDGPLRRWRDEKDEEYLDQPWGDAAFRPLLSAQDLSKYRQFSLGTSLAEVSKQVSQRVDEATSIQQSPATIQEMEWWPVALNFLAKPEPVQKVVFTFYNRTLYKIVATYDNDATAGLTIPT